MGTRVLIVDDDADLAESLAEVLLDHGCDVSIAGHGREAVARVGGLRLMEASEAQIREAARGEARHLYRLEWRPVALSEARPEALPLIVGGEGALAARLGLDHVDSVAAVVARLDEGASAPAHIVFDHLSEPDGSILAAAHADGVGNRLSAEELDMLVTWLRSEWWEAGQ